MKTSKKRELANTVRDAKACLDRTAAEPSQKPDYAQIHQYLADLAPHLNEDNVPKDFIRTLANLYFTLQRYQDAAATLRKREDPSLDGMRRACDFLNGYFLGKRDWLSRQEEIRDVLREVLPQFKPGETEKLQARLIHCFPTRLITVSGEEDEKGLVLLGNPDGIYSLFPMLYLVRHMPEALTAHWDILLDDPDVAVTSVKVQGKPLEVSDVLVRAKPTALFCVGPMVDLELWHPLLRDAQQRSPTEAAFVADYLLSRNLFAAAALSVGHVSVAEEAFAGDDAVPLDHLSPWLRENGILPDTPLEHVYRHRVHAFTRAPSDIPRPRADILRGETCMPELEQIYFLRSNQGLSALQQYGVGCWFLILPKHVCGEDFPAFRTELITALRLDEHDAVCFTGWAEGTRNYYIDFLSLSSTSALRVLEEYLEDLPGGKDVRIATFYWNSVPRTLDMKRETAGQDFKSGGPPEEQVSEEERAALEKAFRETQWKKVDGAPGWDIDNASPYDISMGYLEDALTYVLDRDNAGTPYDYLKVHEYLVLADPPEDAAGASSLYCESMATVLLTLERSHEAEKWMAQAKASGQRDERIGSCRISSIYPEGRFQWEYRRQTFWRQFAAAQSAIAQALSDGGDKSAVRTFRRQADALFPAQELLLFQDAGSGKNILQTGLPGGFLTLPAMLYLTSHYPANLSKRWTITVSAAYQMSPAEVGESNPLTEYQVSLWDRAGTVSLSLWHPQLVEAAQTNPKGAKSAAARMVNLVLPMGARLLYVSDISVAEEAPEDAFPLAELPQQMKDRGYLPDVPLDALLSRRRYTITREPRDTGRPRDDILRGETCIPELEFIYNRLYEEGQVILERHGLTALFLMIPNALCNGDPAQYRQQLQRYLTQAEGDKVFFTGWAEGTEYCYLDLISMHGHSLLSRLDEYAFSNPGGKDLRFSTFYWNAKPLPWERAESVRQVLPESSKQKGRLPPDFPVPDIMAEADLEMSFQRAFEPEDFCIPISAAAPAPAPAPQVPSAVGKKKLSKAQRKAQNSQNNKNNKNSKNNKKKR